LIEDLCRKKHRNGMDPRSSFDELRMIVSGMTKRKTLTLLRSKLRGIKPRWIKKGKRLGFEFKYADVPRTTKSMHIALKDLKLDHLTVVYPGKETFELGEKITAQGLENFFISE
jgi:hypothetical protein